MLQNSFLKTVFLMLVFSAGIMLRMLNIQADPPAGDISRSGSFLGDEGIYTHNAQNFYLTGHWYLEDSFNAAVNTPFYFLYNSFLFKNFGQSLKTARMGSIITSIIFILCLFLFVKKIENSFSYLILLLFLLNFPLYIYSRLALMENMLLLFSCIAILVLFYLHRSVWFTILFWVVVITGYLTKSLIIFLVPVYFIYLWFGSIPKKRKHLFMTFFVILLFIPLYYLFWIHPYAADWHYFEQLNIASRMSFSIVEIIKNVARSIIHLKFYEFMPVLYTIGLYTLFAPVTLKSPNMKKFILINRIWFFTAFVFLALFPYSPPRYWLVAIPPVIILAVLFLHQFADIYSNNSKKTVFIVAMIALLQIFFGLYRFFFLNQHYISCFLPVLAFLPLYILFQKDFLKKPALKKFILISAVILIAGFQIIYYQSTVKYSLFNAMKSVENIIKNDPQYPNIVIAGDNASLFSLELKTKAVDTFYRPNLLSKRFLKNKPDYLILEDPSSLPDIKNRLGSDTCKFQKLALFTIMKNYKHGKNTLFFKIVN